MSCMKVVSKFENRKRIFAPLWIQHDTHKNTQNDQACQHEIVTSLFPLNLLTRCLCTAYSKLLELGTSLAQAVKNLKHACLC